ncbi:hypothetical protein [Permianibacter aggregans]|uniref:Uncharacterized protein n=1 Tax=Permianibacter aggregans TaxID=1510150 RepID=A0A4R6UPD3_9GAMM|nr:hypothetical protein [Permianibacter aggregans]QGX40987.1 hypothetical protein E2H98_15465 [Permianibacter aggregans]TDQ48046.1 hypothetical protein EV696_10826 [Permianibacter aggregans]
MTLMRNILIGLSLTFSLSSSTAFAFDSIYGLRSDTSPQSVTRLDTEALLALGIKPVVEKALIFTTTPTPAWVEGPIFQQQEAHNDDWYFTNVSTISSAVFAVPTETAGISPGEVQQAQLVEEVSSPKAVTRNYLFNKQLISVIYQLQSNCNDETIPYPVQATLTIKVNDSTVIERIGYHDDINPTLDTETQEYIGCERFLETNRNRMAFAQLAFLGDLNGDEYVDTIISVSEKFSYEQLIGLGVNTNGRLDFQVLEADSYAPR